MGEVGARVRRAAEADHARKGGRWLALVPVACAAVVLLLTMPRATLPESIPLPRVDVRVLAEIARADDERAAAAEADRLPTDVLAVGSAIRAFNGVEARGGDEVARADARRHIDAAVRELAGRSGFEEELRALRAVQLRRFLDAIARWERSGDTGDDFEELARVFIERATDAGWVVGRRVVLTDTERRVAFKTVWNALVGAGANPSFALTLDEQRALHVLYIRHPHPSDSSRFALAAERRAATTPEACAKVNAETHRQAELWRADKIRRLGAIDPSYPTSYALGVAYYRAGRYELSAEAFTAFLDDRPDGAYALRARNHLEAALAAAGAVRGR